MKKLLVLGIVSLALTGCHKKHHHSDNLVGALGSQSLPTITYTAVETTDGGSIPSGASDGFDMTGVTKFTLSVCSCFSDGGKGSGSVNDAVTVQDYVYINSAKQWSYNPGMNFTATGNTTTGCMTWGDVQTLVNAKRFKPVVSGWSTDDAGSGGNACIYVDYVQE